MCAMRRRPSPPSTADDLFGLLAREHTVIRAMLEHALAIIRNDLAKGSPLYRPPLAAIERAKDGS